MTRAELVKKLRGDCPADCAGTLCEAARVIEDDDKELESLHKLASRNLPRAPTPFRQKQFRERMKQMTPEQMNKVVDYIMTPEPITLEEFERITKLWDDWDQEKDVHQKALLQMQLGESVAGLLADLDYMTDQVESAKTALSWYAEPSHSQRDMADIPSEVEQDQGKIARDVLRELES